LRIGTATTTDTDTDTIADTDTDTDTGAGMGRVRFPCHRPAAMGVLSDARKHGLIAVVNAPSDEQLIIDDQLIEWGKAAARGGIRMLGIPVSLEDVIEIASELSDEAHISVGISEVTSDEHIALAVAAGAAFVLTPVADARLVAVAKERGLGVLAGALTPTEIGAVHAAGADAVVVSPAGAFGGPKYFEAIKRQFPRIPLFAGGSIDVETAPAFLESGALAAVVDRGVFPDIADPAAVEVIAMRAAALVEVCAEVIGMPSRTSLADVVATRPR
jgi:2-dehydro-3-deoxyphosphogluconate aldolase/(4S)-4-hydroxy-2-oxoglutarate aldolase